MYSIFYNYPIRYAIRYPIRYPTKYPIIWYYDIQCIISLHIITILWLVNPYLPTAMNTLRTAAISGILHRPGPPWAVRAARWGWCLPGLVIKKKTCALPHPFSNLTRPLEISRVRRDGLLKTYFTHKACLWSVFVSGCWGYSLGFFKLGCLEGSHLAMDRRWNMDIGTYSIYFRMIII